MKKFVIAAAAILALSATAANAQAIRIGTEGAYEPWNYVDASGNLAGLDIDVLNELCKRASLECTFVQTAWDTIIPNLNAGNYDVIALRPSRVALLPLETFEWLHATQRAFDHYLLRQINERMHWFLGNFTAHHLLDTDSQVARALAGLFHPWLHPGTDPHLQVSQEEIANLSGVSRQRCNAALKALQAQGVLQIEYGGITVTDLAALRRKVE